MHTLVDRGPPGPLSSVYIHIPFCRDRCTYCAFATIADDTALHQRVVRALISELQRHEFSGTWKTIYLGGGTPGLLSAAHLDHLLDGIRASASPRTPEELTLEANPANITREALTSWAAMGVTRLSLGVQTFDDRALRSLARLHSAETARRALELIAEFWPGTWSADLLLGWEGQSQAQLASDLTELARFEPPHISAYPLELEQGSLLFSRLQNTFKITSKHTETHISDTLFRKHLEPAGLVRYEVSNFANSGHESRHNQAYWANSEYLGLGPGACSSRAGLRWGNLRDTQAWLAAVESGRSARARAERISPPQRLLESLAIGLRTAEGLSRAELERRFGAAWLPVLECAAEAPLDELGLQLTETRLIAPGEHRLRIDAILSHIARNWPDHEVEPA
ncbi:MAG: coproporphyrinogen III oxidase [Planctomycetota bacterium]|nr:MAG: coproporphyrinogen III oxidase [Planctomycetota bacterium]